MTLNPSTKEISHLILNAFLIATFFIYYQTKLIPGTLHAWLLVFGLIFTLPTVLRNFNNSQTRLPVDYALIGFLGVLYLIGYLTNFANATLSQLQAYFLALGCYVFVRENTSSLSMNFLSGLMTYFLLCNGVLVVLQFMTGKFYIANYLAAGDPPFTIPSGVSDGPTKNGMLIAFALSYMLAKLLWTQKRASYLELAVFVLGIVSLILSSSRAGVAAFVVVALIGSTLAAILRTTHKVNRRNVGFIGAILLLPIGAIYGSGIGLEAFVERVTPYADKFALDVMFYKLLGTTEEDSIVARYETARTAVTLITESPLQIFSVGFGLGSFEVINQGLNVHNSYLEVLLETGLYGVLVFAILIVTIVLKALSRRSAVEVFPVLFALLSVMVFMAFHDVLRGRVFWIPLAILGSFAYVQSSSRRIDDASAQAARCQPSGGGSLFIG